MNQPVNPQMQELLKQLEPIVAPPPVGWWPLAPGWWLLIVLLLAAIITFVTFLLMYRRSRAYRRQASALLKAHPPHATQDYAHFVNSVLKRVALSAYPHQSAKISPLSGLDWVQFLQAKGKSKSSFSTSSQQGLALAPYKPSITFDAKQLKSEAINWVHKHKRSNTNTGAQHV